METLSDLLSQASRLLQEAPEESLQIAQKARNMAESAQERLSASLAGRLEGQALRLLGRHEEALTALHVASESAALAQDALLENQIRIGCIDSLCVIGREEEALELAQILKERFTALYSPVDVAKVWVNIGNIHYRRDEYPQARLCFEQALPIFEEVGDTLSFGRVQANLANILSLQNQVEEALQRFTLARKAFMAQGVTPYVAMLDSNVGFLRYISGEHNAALHLMAQARQEFVRRNMEVETAKCEADMADVYRDLNLFPEALERYQCAIALFERLSLSYELARAEHGHAEILFALERVEEAFAALERAERGFLQQKNKIQLAGILITRARFLRYVGNNESACQVAGKALRALRKQNLGGWAAEAAYIIYDVLLEGGENKVRAMQTVKRTALQYHRRWLASRAENALGNYFTHNHSLAKGIKHLRSAVEILDEARTTLPSEEMHSGYLRGKLYLYEDLISALLERGSRGDIIEALEWTEQSKSRLMLERMRNPDQKQEVNDTLQRLRAKLNRAYFQIHSLEEDALHRPLRPETPPLESLKSLEKEYRSALRERDMLAGFPTSEAEKHENKTLSQVQSALKPNETLIEYFALHGELCAFVITSKNVRVERNFASLQEIAYLARRLRYHLQRCEIVGATRASEMATRSILQTLYEKVFKPLEEGIVSDHLIIAPHGVLHGLPFSAFFDGESYLIDKYETLYTPSAAIWLSHVVRPVDSTPRHKQVLLMGISAPGIEQAQVEVEALGHLLPDSHLFLGEQATTQAFLQEVESSRWIHIATHALFRADNPLFSGLLFSDGWLMAHDLYPLRLNCELAMLSACRTGVSCVEPGDELFGLVRGFLTAGVRTLGASLWSADDNTTAQTMSRFYQEMLAGKSGLEALRTTQRAIRESSPHPYYWANFILIGSRL